MWSCGVVMYICLCGFPPFSSDLESKEFPYNLTQQIMGAIFDFPGPWWDSVSVAAMDLIEGMLTLKMAKRFTARQCLEQPWMAAAVPRVLHLDGDVGLESPEPLEA
jgi:serine/threonine-protein kinase CHEK2